MKYKSDTRYFLSIIWAICVVVLLFPLRLLGNILRMCTGSYERYSYFRELKAIKVNGRRLVQEYKHTFFLIGVFVVIFCLQEFYFIERGIGFALDSQRVFTEPWIIVTALFFHGGIGHLLGNILALLLFGRVVEYHLQERYLLYFLLGGACIHCVYIGIIFLFGLEPAVGWGASGAISMFILLAILYDPFAFQLVAGIPLPRFFVGWTLIYTDYLLLGSANGVGHEVHLTGYIMGFLLSVFLARNDKHVFQGLLVNCFLLILFLAAVYFTNIF